MELSFNVEQFVVKHYLIWIQTVWKSESVSERFFFKTKLFQQTTKMWAWQVGLDI